jgi:hypothetical protein
MSKEEKIQSKIKELNDDKYNIEKELHNLYELQKEMNKNILENEKLINEYESKIKNIKDKNEVNRASLEKLGPKIKNNKDKLEKLKIDVIKCENKEKEELLKKALKDAEEYKKKELKAQKALEQEKEKVIKAKAEALESKAVLKKIGIAATEQIFDKSCVYLFCLGKTSELVDFIIPNDKIKSSACIYKFGLTNDITRREGEHKKKYEKFSNVKITLSHQKKCSIIINKENENKLFDMFRKGGFCFVTSLKSAPTTERFNELVVIEDKDLSKVKKFYDEL